MKAFYHTTEKSSHTRVTQLLLPECCANRDGIKQIPEYIVIHEVSLGTGKSPASYNLAHYAKQILTDGLEGKVRGYHYLCGDNAILQFIPDNETAHHTKTQFNDNSIGIERLICEGINYDDALHNQAKLVATLMVKHHIPIDHVITHKETRKRAFSPLVECPNRLLAGMYGGLKGFYQEVYHCLDTQDFFKEVLYPIPSYLEILRSLPPKKDSSLLLVPRKKDTK